MAHFEVNAVTLWKLQPTLLWMGIFHTGEKKLGMNTWYSKWWIVIESQLSPKMSFPSSSFWYTIGRTE